MMVFREEAESGDGFRAEGPLIPVPIQFPQMGVKNAGSPSFEQTVQKTRGEHLLDFIPPVPHPDPAPGGIAPDEFLDRLPVPKGSGSDLPVAGMKAVFPVPKAGERLFGGFGSEGFGGGHRMPGIDNPPQAEGPVLSDDTGDAAPPDVFDPIGHGEVGMIGGVTGLVALPLHDIRPEVGDSLGVVDPDADPAVVFLQFLKGPRGVGPGGGEIPKGVETIDVATADQGADFLPVGFGGIPVGELAGSHVEIDCVPNLQAHSSSHGCLLRGVEKPHQFKIGFGIRGLIEVTANSNHGPGSRPWLLDGG